MKKTLFFITFILCSLVNARSQHYHAVQGSSFAGSLGVANNPASIVNVPYPWDLTLLSFQLQTSTNAITVLNYSLLSSPYKSQYRINKGDYERYARINFDFRILNARIALNRNSAIAFGMNLRNYSDINTSRYNFSDTIKTLRNFLKINENNNNLQANFKSSNWLEIFGTYSRTLWDNELRRLNAGITVKGNRGIAGTSGRIQGTSFTKIIQNNKPLYLVKGGNINYGYSSNLDKWSKNKSALQNITDLIINAQGGLSIDAGLEYIIKPQTVTSIHDEDNYYDYNWKIGVSLLDFGTTRYKYSNQSRSARYPRADLSDASLQNSFFGIKKIQSFNDSLSTVLTDVQQLTGNFNINNPARLVINIDRYLTGNFYLNGELSANLSSLLKKEQLNTSEINLVTVTPRWETRKFGFYLPVIVNTERQFWIGGAVKAGPLLLGFHNLGNVFSQKKMHNGGGYLAFVLKPGTGTKAYRDKRYDCPRIY